MIVPNYWAEARSQHKTRGKQVTIRRYGWSDLSEADAHARAQARADEALQRVLAGERLIRREPKVAYNGAQGVPIREEVLARDGEQVITRNAYGAHCLNSPNALFADVDFNPERSPKPALLTFVGLACAAILVGFLLKSWGAAFALLVVSIVLASPLVRLSIHVKMTSQGGADQVARTRLANFIAQNPAWAVRVYRTPAGLRLLATHQAFDPTSEEVQHFFAAVAVDPVYAQMCRNQRCFRARLTAKPWRIGIAAHMRPRPGVWPVQAQHQAVRDAWISHYEAQAAQYSACCYVESLGSGEVDASLQTVVDLHDSESGALVPGARLA